MNKNEKLEPKEEQIEKEINSFINKKKIENSALKKIIENWKAELVTLIERGQRENSIKNNISGQAVAVYLISAFEGIRGIRKLYQDDLILDEYLNGLSLYLNQLKP